MGAVERIWYGRRTPERIARAALAPASWAYGALVRARNSLYDRALLATHESALPVLSLGNLSVGGTGKTPVSAWAAERLHERGANPAIVLRGYGGDEVLVHARLNPTVIVVADPDRVRGVQRGRDAGADCAILDDGFQHRRLRRLRDWVLVAAEQWRDDLRRLPAGPLREPPGALARADLLIVTRKSASRAEAESIADHLERITRGRASAVCHLAPYALVDAATSNREPLSWLAGRSVLAVAAIGAPAPFFAQLRQQGARVAERAFPDHHAFGASDVDRLVGGTEGAEVVVCTLKDAVKLAPLWPRAGPPLWYVSQRAVIERGASALDASLDVILAARDEASPTAGSAGPSSPAHGYRSSTAD